MVSVLLLGCAWGVCMSTWVYECVVSPVCCSWGLVYMFSPGVLTFTDQSEWTLEVGLAGFSAGPEANLGHQVGWGVGQWLFPKCTDPFAFSQRDLWSCVCVCRVCVQCVHSVCVHVCSVRMCVCSTEGGRVEPGCPGPHVLPLPVSSAGSRQDTWSPRVMRSEAQVRERPPLGAEVPPSAFLPLRCLCLQVSTHPDHLSHVKPFWGHSFLSLLLLPGLPGYSRVVTGDLYV